MRAIDHILHTRHNLYVMVVKLVTLWLIINMKILSVSPTNNIKKYSKPMYNSTCSISVTATPTNGTHSGKVFVARFVYVRKTVARNRDIEF